MLPLVHGINKYGVLCVTAENTATIYAYHATLGEVGETAVRGPDTEIPSWLTRHEKEWTVGYSTLVGHAQGPWTLQANLPPRGPLSKYGGLVMWRTPTGLAAYDVEEQRVVVEGRDEGVLHALLLERAHLAVGARGKTVFAEGVALFDLPRDYTDSIVAVFKAGGEYVDAFTTRGDWWRVHLNTLHCNVVGLGLPRGSRVLDACVY
jgi:hypothetical protein